MAERSRYNLFGFRIGKKEEDNNKGESTQGKTWKRAEKTEKLHE